MTKQEAQLIRTLVQCYRDSKDDRLLAAIELVTTTKLVQEVPPLYFYDADSNCIAATSRLCHTVPPIMKQEDDTQTDTTEVQPPPCSQGVDSSGAVSYCTEDEEDEERQKTDGD